MADSQINPSYEQNDNLPSRSKTLSGPQNELPRRSESRFSFYVTPPYKSCDQCHLYCCWCLFPPYCNFLAYLYFMGLWGLGHRGPQNTSTSAARARCSGHYCSYLRPIACLDYYGNIRDGDPLFACAYDLCTTISIHRHYFCDTKYPLNWSQTLCCWPELSSIYEWYDRTGRKRSSHSGSWYYPKTT